MIELSAAKTALVLIDLQNGILGRPLAPIPADGLLSAGKALAERFRAAGSNVVLVNVAWSADGGDRPKQPVDQAMVAPEGGFPAGFSELAPGLAQPGDILITKRQWGAFTGTELDLQLRRRGIDTIVLGGVGTNFGVESTARHAWELGYGVIIAADATTGVSLELHDMAMRHILPRIARITNSAEVVVS